MVACHKGQKFELLSKGQRRDWRERSSSSRLIWTLLGLVANTSTVEAPQRIPTINNVVAFGQTTNASNLLESPADFSYPDGGKLGVQLLGA